MNKLKTALVMVVFAASSAFAVPSANFTNEVGKIRPELHSSGFGPTVCSQTQQDLDDVKSMGFMYARTHDWALINPNDRVCDMHHIFPLAKLDATNPEYYHFATTDHLLKRTREEAGLKVFYRLGTSIEHSGPKIHFNSLIPEDFDKVAETFAGTVRHYNRGWANGHNWDIKYWEIWNEPDGVNNMWCLPEGDRENDGSPGHIRGKEKCDRRRALFIKFFVTCLKRLKSEFGDEIKVGGPALCNYGGDGWYFREIFEACKAAGVAPDFISWHGYTRTTDRFVKEADNARALCDEFGFTKCELIVNEWHYFGENYSWDDMQRCSDPKIKARIWEGPDSHNGIRSSCFTLATLANLQRSKLDQAYYYGCRHTGSWGFKDELQKKYSVFYALKLFGDIVRDYSTFCEAVNEGSITLFPVREAKGRKSLLVIDYGGAARSFSVEVAGIAEGAKVSGVLLDYQHNLAPLGVGDLAAFVPKFEKGKLTFTKPDFHSAAFFVQFEE